MQNIKDEEEVKRRYNYSLSYIKEDENFIIEQWYDKLKDFTPKSFFLPLNQKEQKELYAFIKTLC